MKEYHKSLQAYEQGAEHGTESSGHFLSVNHAYLCLFWAQASDPYPDITAVTTTLNRFMFDDTSSALPRQVRACVWQS